MIRIVFFILFLAPSAFAALFYLPANLRVESANVVVVIHGCLQSGESMALGTGWNQIADKNNLVILYPQVPENSNPLGCWSWFLPENQKADVGQLKNIHDEILTTKKFLQMKTPRVFLAGLSAGATTVAGLISCFPNDFTSAAIHSGPSYGLAQNVFEGDQVLKVGPPEVRPQTDCKPNLYSGSVILIHGNEDTKVNIKNTNQVISDFANEATAMPTKELSENGSTYQVTDYWLKDSVKLRYINIQKLPHAWGGYTKNLRYGSLVGPGGQHPTQIPFFSQVGPSSTNLIWDFFKVAK